MTLHPKTLLLVATLSCLPLGLTGCADGQASETAASEAGASVPQVQANAEIKTEEIKEKPAPSPAAKKPAARGRSFMDTTPVATSAASQDAAPDSAPGNSAPDDSAPDDGNVGSGDRSALLKDPSALPPPVVSQNQSFSPGLNPQLAMGLREDPGQTAGDSIEGLITFGDLSLLGADVDELLDYIYKPDTERAKRFKFPDTVIAKAGEDKAIIGYMIALEYKPKTNKITSFMLVRDLQACCFGGVPRPDEWVMVEMAEGLTTDYHMYVPVTVRGTFTPGRIPDEYGYAAAVYNMTAESVTRYSAPVKAREFK